MTKFFATARLVGAVVPRQATVEAATTLGAIEKLCELLGVSTTTDIEEFELLEVLGGDKYRSAARKTKADVKRREQKPAPTIKADVVKAAVFSETAYLGYKVRAA